MVTILVVVGYTEGASIPGECCKEKMVGGVSYVLVEETDTGRYGCHSNCVFEKVDSPGSRFCFKEGDLEVVCEDDDNGGVGSGSGQEEPPPINEGPEVGRSVCSYSSDHTLNLYPGPADTCGAELLYAGLDPWAREMLLNKHNELRQRVASGGEEGQPAASNMRKLVWSEELENTAQRWADQCQGQVRDEVRDLCDGTPVGQNIFLMSSDSEDPVETIESAMASGVESWYSQVILPGFLPEDISPYRYIEGTEEYSQLVWAETTQVGCGLVYYQGDDSLYHHVLVCNYAPGGNYDGDLYLPGQACANCPLGTQCDQTYPALCTHL